MADTAHFEMPEAMVVDEATATLTYSRFVAEPMEKGFGHTLGNSLRRVLLSSLDGIAVSWIRIDGVPHEFTTMDDVIEDVTEIVLNFKKVRFKSEGELPRKLTLKTSKAGVITAADISLDGVTKIVNPEQMLLTVDQARDIHVEFEIVEGRGYRPAEENKQEDHPIGVIPVDCLFSPVVRVAYSVHDCRVGQRTDYDSLELEVWTDGRMEPKDAVKQAAAILGDHLAVFSGGVASRAASGASLINSPEDEAMLRKMLRNVNELQLSVRAQNCLDNANLRYFGEVIQKPESELLKYRNFGQKSADELKVKMLELDCSLGMEIKETVRQAFEKEVVKLRAGQED
jgi:DNA-directed RNA polymerase subunit alpha